MKQYNFLLIPLLTMMLLVFQLAGCSDKEGEQRKAFTDFLQNTVLRGGEQIPTLSEDQRQKFGRHVSDYAILMGFSQQIQKSVDIGLIPLITLIAQIKVPKDYALKHTELQQALGMLNLLGQQIQSDKMQADNAMAVLEQPDDLKAVYGRVYNKIVNQPTNRLLPLIPQLSSLTQDIIQVGEFLTAQGNQVNYANGGIQLSAVQSVDQYNALMQLLKVKLPILRSIREQVQGLKHSNE